MAFGGGDNWDATPDRWTELEEIPGEFATLGAGCYWFDSGVAMLAEDWGCFLFLFCPCASSIFLKKATHQTCVRRGTEKFIARDFAKQHPGAILGTAVGFMGPAGRF
jgi:hypothetical protein